MIGTSRYPGRREGFTLIETVTTIAILSIVGLGASVIILTTAESYLDSATAGQLHTEASMGLDRAVRALRKVGLDPTASGIAPDIDDVTATSIEWNDGGAFSLSLSGGQIFYGPSGVARANAWTTGLTHDAGSGANRLLLFVVGYENGADPGVSSITYGGQSLVSIAGAVAGTSTYGRVELWYLNEAGIAAASGNTFIVVWGGAAPSLPVYASATYAGVDQASPILNSSTNSTDTATPNPLTTTVSVVNGAMAVSGVFSGNNGSYTWNNGWSEGTDQNAGSTCTMSSGENPATAPGTDTASATHSGPNRQAIAGASLNPAGTATILLDDVTAFTVQTYNESNTPLAATLSGAACDPIRRISLELTVQRADVSETLRTKVFVRSTMIGRGL